MIFSIVIPTGAVTIDRFPMMFINVTEGTLINLTCVARGMPEPNVLWLREVPGAVNDEITSTSKTTIIEHARVADSGTYVCNAHNAILLSNGVETRSVSESITIKVHQKPMDRSARSCACFLFCLKALPSLRSMPCFMHP